MFQRRLAHFGASRIHRIRQVETRIDERSIQIEDNECTRHGYDALRVRRVCVLRVSAFARSSGLRRGCLPSIWNCVIFLWSVLR